MMHWPESTHSCMLASDCNCGSGKVINRFIATVDKSTEHYSGFGACRAVQCLTVKCYFMHIQSNHALFLGKEVRQSVKLFLVVILLFAEVSHMMSNTMKCHSLVRVTMCSMSLPVTATPSVMSTCGFRACQARAYSSACCLLFFLAMFLRVRCVLPLPTAKGPRRTLFASTTRKRPQPSAKSMSPTWSFPPMTTIHS